MPHAASDSLTILVTTYERYPQLRRLLRYGAAVENPFPIRVLDSSREALTLDDLLGRFNTDHLVQVRFESTTPPMEKIREGLKAVTTPYVVLWADDDFLVPRSVALGMSFLDEHPDYSVVHGQSALFSVEATAGRAGIQGVVPYPQHALTDRSASHRLRNYLGRSHAVLNYSVHRTDSLKRNVEACCVHRLGYRWAELTLGSLSAIQGKVGRMDRLYLLKQTHRGADAWRDYLLTESLCQRDDWNEQRAAMDPFEWIIDQQFAEKYEAFRECLAAALTEAEGIILSQAREVIKEAFWPYLARLLTQKWQARQQRHRWGWSEGVREAARSLPGLRTTWRAVRQMAPHGRRALSLPALLRASSPYHADFLPIHRAVMAETASSFAEGQKRVAVAGAAGAVQ